MQLFLVSASASAVTQEELLKTLTSVSTSLKVYAGDIETLTEKYKTDSMAVNMKLLSLENHLNMIESGSEDMKNQDQEFEKQLILLTSSFREYKQKVLTPNIIQCGVIVVLAGVTILALRK